MSSSGMLRLVAFVRTDVSEERIAEIWIAVTEPDIEPRWRTAYHKHCITMLTISNQFC
jgi:hypothetical protein